PNLTRDLEQARAGLAEVEQEIAGLEASLQEHEASLSKLRQGAAAAESRLDTLLELKRNFDGVSEGVKFLFRDADRAGSLLGVVADVLEVPSRYLDALEASLGEA